MGNRLLIILLAVVLVSAFTNGFGLLFRLAYVMVGALLLSAIWTWAGVHWVRVSIKRGSDHSQVGQSFEDKIEIHNTSRLPKPWLELRDNSDLPGRNATAVMGLPPGKSRLWSIETKCSQRGRFTLGPVTVVSSDPFGLFKWERTIGKPHDLLVYPATVPLRRFSPHPAHLLGEGPLRRRAHHVTPNAFGVRDYAFGDSFNRIHWRSTARTGRLMVKEFELDPSSDVWVLLDMQEAVQAGRGAESTEEYGAIIAASVAKRFLERGRAVGLVAWGQRLDMLRAEKGAGQLSRIMESLALARAVGKVPLAEIIATESRRFSRHSTVIAITPSTDGTWAAELHYLTSRRTSVAAILMEASTFGAEVNPHPVLDSLAASGIPTYLVKRGDTIGKALSETFQAPQPLAIAS